MGWSPSVIVSTYNAPRALELVLAGLHVQSRAPAEIVVADDGSTAETTQLLERWRGELAVPLRHVRHDDEGFRKSRIVNESVARATGDYLCFLDGDTVPHRHWLKDHLFHARPSRVLCGRRVRLGPDVSPRVNRRWIEDGVLGEWFGELSRSGDTRNFGRGLRLPAFVAFFLRLRGRKLMGCNFSLPRDAFISVNGYDEDFDGFGGEDYDLGVRLRNAGYRMTPLINRGCAYHLFHPMRRMADEVRRLRDAKAALSRTRCEHGLDTHPVG
jgi:glycosyltransferase involved in cell wall biosynthesis